jgi:glutathione S-transferase
MKLYSANLSPFASRARLAIYAKGLDIEISYPPAGGMKSPEYLAINPLGKAPCLQTPTGEGIPESYVILEYLEEVYPEPSLLKGTPEQRARIRLIARIADLYVMSVAQGLFGQMNPATRDQAVVDAQLEKLTQGLAWLECYLGEDGYAAGADFSIADCMLAPTLIWLPVFAQTFGRPGLMEGAPKLAAYAGRARAHPAVAKVWAEMEKAIGHYRETGQIS